MDEVDLGAFGGLVFFQVVFEDLSSKDSWDSPGRRGREAVRP
jgi:hypothetical protein